MGINEGVPTWRLHSAVAECRTNSVGAYSILVNLEVYRYALMVQAVCARMGVGTHNLTCTNGEECLHGDCAQALCIAILCTYVVCRVNSYKDNRCMQRRPAPRRSAMLQP